MTTISTLPIIDIAPYLTPNNPEARAATSASLHKACVEYGFFYLDLSAYIDLSEPEELLRLGREFFALPQDQKDVIALSNQDYARGSLVWVLITGLPGVYYFSGYARLKENVTNGKADNHEGIDFYRPVEKPDKSKPLWGENQWPAIPTFKEKYDLWVGKMKALGLIVMEACVWLRRGSTGQLLMFTSEWQKV
jgi:isopenicillin N synthase-like dioxygenase